MLLSPCFGKITSLYSPSRTVDTVRGAPWRVLSSLIVEFTHSCVCMYGLESSEGGSTFQVFRGSPAGRGRLGDGALERVDHLLAPRTQFNDMTGGLSHKGTTAHTAATCGDS